MRYICSSTVLLSRVQSGNAEPGVLTSKVPDETSKKKRYRRHRASKRYGRNGALEYDDGRAKKTNKL